MSTCRDRFASFATGFLACVKFFAISMVYKEMLSSSGGMLINLYIVQCALLGTWIVDICLIMYIKRLIMYIKQWIDVVFVLLRFISVFI